MGVLPTTSVIIAVALASFPHTALAGCRRGRSISQLQAHWNDGDRLLLEKHRMPKQFNWCDRGGVSFCSASWGQHDQTLAKATYCGACWVHGTLSALQDRLKIEKYGKQGGYPGQLDTILSRQTMLNCGAFEGMGGGCDGGDPIDVFHYMSKFGLPDSTCQSYTASDHSRWKNETEEGHCPKHAICSNCMPVKKHGREVDTCWAVERPLLYFVKGFGRVEGTVDEQEHAMMSEIHQYGPIVCSIATPEDFTYDYRRGVFNDTHNYNETDIDHNVEVVGWGHEHGQDFWVIRNSWGSYWGELGFFRIPRGSNSLMIENGDCWYADVTWDDEKAVRAGKLAGSMYGLVDVEAEERGTKDQGLSGARRSSFLVA